MDKLYKKNELGFSLFLIIDYIVFYSAAEVLSKRIGVEKSLTFVLLSSSQSAFCIGSIKMV